MLTLLLPLALYAHEASTFRVCDRNQDGLLTEEEYLSRSCGGVIEFGDFDGNQDGLLSEAEYALISRPHSHDGCDPDPNVGCVIVTAPGSPPIWWWPPSGGGGYDPNPPGCSFGDPDCDDGGGGGGGFDPVACNNLINGDNNPNYVQGNPDAPIWCSTDPGSSSEVNYNVFITDYLGSILGDLNGPCTSGCYWSNNYPYMTGQLVNTALNIFGDAYYNTLDYISSRDEVWNLLTSPCRINFINSYSPNGLSDIEEFSQCMDSQADFFYSMTPTSSVTSPSSWSTSLGYQAPWGGLLSFSYNSSAGYNSNWVSDFLTEVGKTRQCHTWYQALNAANCQTP